MNDRYEKDARLGEDIRLLGRILGDTVRAYEGEATFALVEDIRQLAVASRREEDTAARERLSKVLDGLTAEQAVMVIRAFSYFSLLANIARTSITFAATATTCAMARARCPRRCAGFSPSCARINRPRPGRSARSNRSASIRC